MRLSNTVAVTSAPFFASLPRAARMRFFAAVFLVFAPLILIFNSVLAARTLGQVLVWTAISGLIAVCWAAAFIVNRWYLVAALALSLVAAFSLGTGYPPQLRLHTRAPNLVSIAIVLMIAAGYVFFVLFIAGEGVRTLRLQTEMRLAQRIHGHLVPRIARRNAMIEVYGRSDASSEMGGDLLDEVQHDDGVDFYLADVSGHGVRAGVLMAMVKSALRMRVLESSPLESVIRDLDRIIQQVKEQDMFVTCAAVRIESPGQVDCCLAGHLPILHFRAASKTLETIDNDSLPLGVVDDELFTAHRVTCGPGDLLVLYTDGLIEVMDRQGRQFGIERFCDLIKHNANKTLAEIHTTVTDAARAHGPRADDQTLLLIRINPNAAE